MKKLIAFFLACCMLLGLAACTKSAEPAAESTPVPAATETPVAETPVPEETAEPVVEEEAPIVDTFFAQLGASDYGVPMFVVDTIDHMEVNMAYPSGFETLDAALQKWADGEVKNYADKSSLLPDGENGIKGTLITDYYSYEYKNYVSVLEFGEFEAAVGGNYQQFVKGIIFDSDLQSVVTLKDLFSETDYASLYEKVIADAAADGMDLTKLSADELLKNAVLWDNMVIIAYTNGTSLFHVCEVYEEVPVLTPTPVPTPKVTPTPAPTATPVVKPTTQKAYVNGNKVHIRAEASSKSKSLALVPIAYEIEVVDTDASSGWTRIWFDKGFAYIFTNYVTYKTPKIKTTSTGYVNGKSVNVRSEPNTTSKKLGVVTFRTAVKIILKEYVQGWDQILYNGKVAYISSKYIDDTKPTPVPTATPKPKQVKPSWYSGRPQQMMDLGVIKTNNVQAKTAADDNANYFKKLKKGDTVFIVEEGKKNGWHTVWIESDNDATTGYFAFIKSSYVDIERYVGPVY